MAKNIQKVHEDEFGNILDQIQHSKQKAFTQVNAILVELFWNIGKHISHQVDKNSWGRGVEKELAEFIMEKEANIKGFGDKNLWRMKQFFGSYKANQKLSALLTQLTWTKNLLILSATKSAVVVKYALISSISPAVIAKYETALIPKKLLRNKLIGFYRLLELEE